MTSCSLCSSPMVIRKASDDYFWGCSKFPDCKSTKKMDRTDDTFPWVTASSIGSAKFCPNTVYLKKRQAASKHNKKMLRGQRAHRLASRDERCFIASYTFHDDHPIVNYLRAWRDTHLLSHWYGKIFIKFYYFFSPFMICVFKTLRVKKIIRKSLIRLVKILRKKF